MEAEVALFAGDVQAASVAELGTAFVDRARLVVKRTIDVVGAIVLLVLAVPVLAAAAVLVRLGDGGPAVFRQERVGLNGRLFRIYKFRTMVVDQDAVLDRTVYEEREKAGLLTKLPNDPRVTPVGRLLRRSSIDELPQLLNVLKGDMSLVGPRPLLALQLAPFPEISRERCRMRPGLTGAWQISDRTKFESVESMADADIDYVARYRVWRDVWILLSTIPACVRGGTV